MMKRNFAALIFASVMGTISPASAVEFSFPGLTCVQEGNDGFQGLMYGSGSVRNISTTTNVDVYCPIQQYTTTEDVISLSVLVIDSHTSDKVDCYIRTCEADGTACVNSSTMTTGNAFQGTVQLSFSNVSINADGVTYLHCNLPEIQGGGYSNVISYRWKDI
jgi:hypothetical protein